jgi:hypothetical protein
MRAAHTLVELGAYDPDTPVRFWQGGKWREVYVRHWVVVDEPDTEYDPDVADMVNEAVGLTQEGKLEEAEKLYRRALKRDPSVKEAWGNLGAMAIWAGDQETAEKHLSRALEVDPLYPFAVCNLAMLRINENRLDEAHELLQPLSTRTRFTHQEMIYYMRVQARLALLEKEYEAARHSLEYILELVPDDEDAQQQLAHLDLLSLADRFSDWTAEYRARARLRWEKRRAKTILTPDSNLAEGMVQFTKDVLVGMTHALGITGISGKRKAEMFDYIVDWLSDPDAAAYILPDLTTEDRAALRYVLDAGGWVSWEAFSQRHGDDSEESPYWNYHQPETVMGRLRVRGLLVEGTMDGEAIILVPRDLREPLTRLLADESEGEALSAGG